MHCPAKYYFRETLQTKVSHATVELLEMLKLFKTIITLHTRFLENFSLFLELLLCFKKFYFLFSLVSFLAYCTLMLPKYLIVVVVIVVVVVVDVVDNITGNGCGHNTSR